MLLPNRYNISDAVLIFIGAICILPILLNVLGMDFGFVYQQFDPYRVTKFVEIEKMDDFREFIRGRYVHTIFVSSAIAIAFLTAILAFVDFSIKKELSTPVVGIALFCSGLFDAFHILVSTNIVYAPSHQFYITSLTWFYCRLFHASILLLCVGVFLFQSRRFQDEAKRNAQRFIFYMGSIFILLTLVTIGVLFMDTDIPSMAYPYRNAARSYDFFPLALYLMLAFWILPKFVKKYPSVFSKTLLLSMIPAIATQLYMTFGSIELFDNSFNISHFMAAFTFFIPFVGVSLNYVETSKNEKKVIRRLNVEAEERRIAEETLSSVLNSSTSCIMAFKSVHDSSDKIVDFKWTVANPATENLLALDYRKLHGKRLLRELPIAEKEGLFEIFKNVVEKNELVNHEYFSEYFQKWFYVVATKLKDGLAVTFSDVSQRKNATQELVNAERLAITGIVARTVAHEVRNPLTNINLSIDYLKGDLQPEDTVYLDIIKRNSERINQLITELLNSSKPAELTLTKYPLNRLLDETLERAIDRLQLKGIKLEKKYEEQEILINADAEKLKTALLNIILNAIEAMDENKGVLNISSKIENKRCIVKIEDNGHGISEENLNKLFEPFFTRKNQGMGLGLSATHNIITAHKGVLHVESELGRGTLFIISLPLEAIESNVAAELA
jgi:signal transduction histidine kinase